MNICCETCMNAKPESPCKCRCGGLHHAQNSKEDMGSYDRTVNESLGGEVAEFIKNVKGKNFYCFNARGGHHFVLNHFIAYPHDGGLADSKGERWWVYVVCPHCKYQWSWVKIPNRLENQKVWEAQEEQEERERKEAESQDKLLEAPI